MQKYRMFTRSILIVLGLVAATAVLAHTNEYLDTLDGEHGGQLRMSGAYHFELIAAPGKLTVYVTDHAWQPVETAGASANAMVITNGKKTVLDLQVSGSNMLEGSGDFMLDEKSTVHLKVSMPDGAAELATFQPLRKRQKQKAQKSGGHEHHH